MEHIGKIWYHSKLPGSPQQLVFNMIRDCQAAIYTQLWLVLKNTLNWTKKMRGELKIVVVDKGIKIGLKTEWDIKLQR